MSIGTISITGSGPSGFLRQAEVGLSGFPDPGHSAGAGTRLLTGGLFAYGGAGSPEHHFVVSVVGDPTSESRAVAVPVTGSFAQCQTSGGMADVAAIDLGQFEASCDGTVCSAIARGATVLLAPGERGVTDVKGSVSCGPAVPLALLW